MYSVLDCYCKRFYTMRPPTPITEDIKEAFCYDPTSPSGLRFKTISKFAQKNVDDPAGSKHKDKNGKYYWRIKHRGKWYGAHRIVWYLNTGEDPGTSEIDHKDRDETNNTFGNLRLANRGQNVANRFFLGVTETNSGFCVRVQATFPTKEEALQAYTQTASFLKGEFSPG